MTTNNSLLSIKEVSKRLSLSKRSIYKLIDVSSENPKLKSKTIGKRRLVAESELSKFINDEGSVELND